MARRSTEHTSYSVSLDNFRLRDSASNEISSEPTTVLTYLFKMTHVLSSSYEVLRIVGQEPELMKARMALYDTARIVLNNGMRLLGLTPVDR